MSYFTGVAVDILRSSENELAERLVEVVRDLSTRDTISIVRGVEGHSVCWNSLRRISPDDDLFPCC